MPTTPTPVTPFDPSRPLPPDTLSDIRATGAGQASSGKLRATCNVGVAVALGLAAAGFWWLGVWPLAIACLSGHALAIKARQRLDLHHTAAPGKRRLLHVARAATALAALACVVAGGAILLGWAMRWAWTAEVLGG